MDKILIDSDIILDLFLDRKPHVEYSKKILELCFQNKIAGYTTAIIVSNIIYIARKQVGIDILRKSILQLLKIVDIICVSRDAIQISLMSAFKDDEDAMQNFAADENGNISTIVTRNVKDYKGSRLKVMTPKQYLERM